MSISILNRGASGGLKPELTVTASSGSTIDLLQNGIIIDTYTLGASETEHTFVVKVGTYTVRGTLGTQTKDMEVVIDTVGQYKVEITYILWLYHEGDECEEVTGGWKYTTSYSSLFSLTKTQTSLQIKSGLYSDGNVNPSKTIDLTGYKSICVEYHYDGLPSGHIKFHFCGTEVIQYASVKLNSPVKIPVENSNTTNFIYVGNTDTYSVFIDKIWLE